MHSGGNLSTTRRPTAVSRMKFFTWTSQSRSLINRLQAGCAAGLLLESLVWAVRHRGGPQGLVPATACGQSSKTGCFLISFTAYFLQTVYPSSLREEQGCAVLLGASRPCSALGAVPCGPRGCPCTAAELQQLKLSLVKLIWVCSRIVGRRMWSEIALLLLPPMAKPVGCSALF